MCFSTLLATVSLPLRYPHAHHLHQKGPKVDVKMVFRFHLSVPVILFRYFHSVCDFVWNLPVGHFLYYSIGFFLKKKMCKKNFNKTYFIYHKIYLFEVYGMVELSYYHHKSSLKQFSHLRKIPSACVLIPAPSFSSRWPLIGYVSIDLLSKPFIYG